MTIRAMGGDSRLGDIVQQAESRPSILEVARRILYFSLQVYSAMTYWHIRQGRRTLPEYAGRM